MAGRASARRFTREPTVNPFVARILYGGVLDYAITVLVGSAFFYTTYLAQSLGPARDFIALVVIGVLAFIGVVVVIQQQPRWLTLGMLSCNWHLHLYTGIALGATIAGHPDRLSANLVAYVLVAYAAYLALPLAFARQPRLFFSWVRVVAVLSAMFALPAWVGAAGVDSLAGLPLYNKVSYSGYTGIIASAGLMEHVIPFAAQMGIGLLCSVYLFRKTGAVIYLCMGLLTLGALVISQGRGAWLGVIASMFVTVLPRVVRRRPLYLVAFALLAALAPLLLIGLLDRIAVLSSALRLSAGLSGREGGWLFALLQIYQEPWLGHGFQSASEMTAVYSDALDQLGFHAEGASFHNTFLTKAVEFGVPVMLLYAWLFLRPVARVAGGTRWPLERWLVRSVCLLAFVASFYVEINVGGVRSVAVINAVFLGFANAWPLVEERLGSDPTLATASRRNGARPSVSLRVSPGVKPGHPVRP